MPVFVTSVENPPLTGDSLSILYPVMVPDGAVQTRLICDEDTAVAVSDVGASRTNMQLSLIEFPLGLLPEYTALHSLVIMPLLVMVPELVIVPELVMVSVNTVVIPEDIDSVLPLAIVTSLLMAHVVVPAFHNPSN